MTLINAKASIRFKAFLWDLLFCAIYMILAIILSAIISEITFWLFDFYLVDLRYFMDVLYLSSYVYFFFSDFFTKSGSIGKKIMKLKIVSEHGLKAKKRNILLRGFGNIFMIVDVLFCRINIDRHSISDSVSNTRVVYATEEVLLKHENVDIDKGNGSI